MDNYLYFYNVTHLYLRHIKTPKRISIYSLVHTNPFMSLKVI